MRRWWSDARHFQIVALSSLLLINFFWIDFGARPLYAALAITSALVTQVVCARLFGLPNIDLRSPLITGLSLSLLLRANESTTKLNRTHWSGVLFAPMSLECGAKAIN